MSTKKPREQKFIFSFVRELVLKTLERREDMDLSLLAYERLRQKDEIVSHEGVWDDLLKKD